MTGAKKRLRQRIIMLIDDEKDREEALLGIAQLSEAEVDDLMEALGPIFDEIERTQAEDQSDPDGAD